LRLLLSESPFWRGPGSAGHGATAGSAAPAKPPLLRSLLSSSQHPMSCFDIFHVEGWDQERRFSVSPANLLAVVNGGVAGVSVGTTSPVRRLGSPDLPVRRLWWTMDSVDTHNSSTSIARVVHSNNHP
jgi:hypothetical protein